jgi:O-antigen/teichoic acid export membrane protein
LAKRLPAAAPADATRTSAGRPSKVHAVKRPGRRDLSQLVIGPLRNLHSDWQDPLLRNGYALIVNVGITSVFGLAYWILAAHLYTPADVGIGVAAISLMQFLVGVGGQVTFQTGLTRFIPHAGRDSTRFALLSYGLAGGAGAMVSLAYIGGLHIHALGLPVVLGRSWILSVALGASVTVWCVFALQDAVLTGIRQAVWIPLENGLYGIGKIVLLIALARITGRYGIFVSWTVPALIALLPVNLLIFGRLLPRHIATRADQPTTVTFRTMSRFMGGDYVGTLFFMATETLLPVLILARLGKPSAAYFGVVWVIIVALDLITINLGIALMVEGVIDRAALRSAAATVVRRLALIIVPAVVVLLLFAPQILSIYGHEYAMHGAGLLRLLSLAVLARAVTSLYFALSRVERRVSRIALAQGALFASIAGLSWWLMGHLGINGVGVGYLISQVAVAAVLFPLILKMLAPVPPAPPPAESISHDKAQASRGTTSPKMGPKAARRASRPSP